jgi:hypothetical protein
MITDEYRALFNEIDSTIQHDLSTDNITIGLNVSDLIGVARLANQAQRNDILHIIQDVALEQHEAAPQGSSDKRLYRAVGNVVGSLLFANREISIDKTPALSEKDFRLYMTYARVS